MELADESSSSIVVLFILECQCWGGFTTVAQLYLLRCSTTTGRHSLKKCGCH